jgi:hypothetical protein
MRFANNILENNCRIKWTEKPWGQLSGMKKLLAKGENGKFWAKDFDIKGYEMVGLAYLDCIKETGVTKEVEIQVEAFKGWNSHTKTYETEMKTLKVTAKEWELTDYERLAKAYELIMALLNL